MRENCAETWDKHWQCLEMNNQASGTAAVNMELAHQIALQNYYRCRTQEKSLNECVFDKLVGFWNDPNEPGIYDTLQGIKKVIPGAPPNQPQIHEKKNPVYTGVQK
jgi:NADH dehydrogenase (ubiquinone) 1 alpha subcomplex subunit 8